ncbi:zincin [Eremomyces bilateralis CBS 781.70]|uniref:Zincin n=1 Tax=Eremomyces bilateralis CBS 781.70 TaxID=1392243 RepID=A0A6G1GFN3_9PEZI|nr:zincin [Eremomyces bilateralis CBS 781.70]KAF1816660.1 zincin [Eremomyces bilateralis CBS 781.70]
MSSPVKKCSLSEKLRTPKKHVCSFIPPHILRSIATSDRADDDMKTAARTTLDSMGSVHEHRLRARTIYDLGNTSKLPGKVARTEGASRVKDRDVNNVYEGFNNAYWDGERMVFGDGDGIVFHGICNSLDVIAHELTHGLTQFTANFEYEGESGALNESMSDVFACMVEQKQMNQTVHQADWLIGQTIFPVAFKGTALRSLKDPGNAYVNDPVLGTDPQPKDYASRESVKPTSTFKQFSELTVHVASKHDCVDEVTQAWKTVSVKMGDMMKTVKGWGF